MKTCPDGSVIPLNAMCMYHQPQGPAQPPPPRLCPDGSRARPDGSCPSSSQTNQPSPPVYHPGGGGRGPMNSPPLQPSPRPGPQGPVTSSPPRWPSLPSTPQRPRGPQNPYVMGPGGGGGNVFHPDYGRQAAPLHPHPLPDVVGPRNRGGNDPLTPR